MKQTPNALYALQERYFLRNSENEIIENEEQLWKRIAHAVAAPEKDREAQQYWAPQFEKLMVDQDFFPNSPTIMNAGLRKGQLSACFVLPIEDTIRNRKDGIFDTLADTAVIHQSGGGTGFDFSRLRPKGAQVDSKQGVASGPISFASVYDKGTEEMKQGGKRKGANMMILRVDHPDILDFIDMKMTPGVMTNFNVSVAITDEFMEALHNDGEYDLHHKSVGIVGRLRAKDVWDRIASNAHRSAEPGLVFIDRINDKSPYEEPIEATNPCGEQPLPPYGSCNLGSINLSRFVVDKKVDWHRLEYVIRTATRFLDNVIDANHYPTPELDAHAKKYRNIGLGGMGLAGMFMRMEIVYGSLESIELARELQLFLNKVSHDESFELGKEKGLPSGAPFKSFFYYSSPHRRNATLTTWAPTGSLSMFADCDSGCEPAFTWEYEMHRLDTVLQYRHPVWAEAVEEHGLLYVQNAPWFIQSQDVPVEGHVGIQAALQENCDSAISKTINLARDVDEQDVKDAYDLAWKLGLKGITVYRDGSREGVLVRTVEKEADELTDAVAALTLEEERCCDNPNIVYESGCETCKNCTYSACLIA